MPQSHLVSTISLWYTLYLLVCMISYFNQFQGQKITSSKISQYSTHLLYINSQLMFKSDIKVQIYLLKYIWL